MRADGRMQIRMHFSISRAGSASMPTGSRAKARFHRHPYAVVCTVCSSLKRKRAEKAQLPKEVHKVHTALRMCSQPYSRLASCSSRKSAYGLHAAAYEVHTDA
jgi:hypothetical protein